MRPVPLLLPGDLRRLLLRLHHLRPAALVLLASLTVVAITRWVLVQSIERREQELLEVAAADTVGSIRRHLESHLDVLRAGRAVLQAEPSVEALRLYLVELLRDEAFPAFTDFTLLFPGEEGVKKERVGVGAGDLPSELPPEGVLRDALGRAVERDGPVAIPDPKATYELGVLPVYWVVLPYHRPKAGPGAKPAGFLAGRLRLDLLLGGVPARARGTLLGFEVYEGTQVAPAALIFDDDLIPDAPSQLGRGRPHLTRRLPVADLTWTVFLAPRAHFDFLRPGLSAVLMLTAGGVIISLLLFGVLAVQLNARTAADAARQRATLLAEASRVLGASFDYRAALSEVTQLLVPSFADWCLIAVGGPEDLTRATAWQVAAPGKLLPPEPWPLLVEVAQSQVSRIEAGTPAQLARSTGAPPAVAAQLAALELGCCLAQPMVLRGRTLGVILLARTRCRPRFGPAEQVLVQELSARASFAMENAQLYEDAQRAVRLRDDFLSVASHELNTPLTPLKLQLQVLSRQLDQGKVPDVPALRRHQEKIEKQVLRLGRLVKDLLDVSRISAGKLHLQLEALDLALLVRENVERYRDDLTRAGCEVRLSTAGDTVGRWDPMRLEQVVINLLTNVIKYAPGRPVDIRVEGDEHTCTLTVRDQGTGIPTEALDRIFERFERVASARRYPGMGLGLYIVREIVGALGGAIDVHSEVGAGTTFIVRLPKHPATAEV